MVRLYIEANGDRYRLDPRQQYLVYYKGCFCPPHRGHFSTLVPFLGYPNVKIFIHQIGNEKRHGVPHHLSQLMWKTYLEELVPNQWHLVPYERTSQVREYLTGINRVLYLRGDEGSEVNPTLFDGLDEKFGLPVDVLIGHRLPIPQLSATNFTNYLLHAQRHHYDSDKLWHKLSFFLPRKLSRSKAVYLLKKLVNLTTLRIGPKPLPT